jgi:hypothetical protein
MAKLVHDPQFMFRDAELERILMQLNQNKSVLLTGIRRTGKTQVVKEALFRYQESGGEAHYLDVQDYVSLNSFYRDLLAVMPQSVKQKLNDKLAKLGAVPTKFMTWFSSHISKVGAAGVSVEMTGVEVRSGDDALARYWETIAEQLMAVLSEQGTQKLPVVGIDELPFMMENLIERNVSTAELTVMLASIRKLRDAGLRLIIAGSISMENLLQIHKIPHTVLGGLWRELIPPFSEIQAKQYLAKFLAGSYAADEKVITMALQVLPDYVPEFLRVSVGYLQACRDWDECEKVMHQQVIPHIRRSFLHQFEERLAKHYNHDETDIAELVLDVLAKGDEQGSKINGSEMPRGYRQVLVKLQFDNFIIDGPDFTLCFSLKLLRQWWCASRGIA